MSDDDDNNDVVKLKVSNTKTECRKNPLSCQSYNHQAGYSQVSPVHSLKPYPVLRWLYDGSCHPLTRRVSKSVYQKISNTCRDLLLKKGGSFLQMGEGILSEFINDLPI